MRGGQHLSRSVLSGKFTALMLVPHPALAVTHVAQPTIPAPQLNSVYG